MQQEKIPKEGNYCFQIGRNVSKIVCEEQIRLAGEVSASANKALVFPKGTERDYKRKGAGCFLRAPKMPDLPYNQKNRKKEIEMSNYHLAIDIGASSGRHILSLSLIHI